MGVKKTQVLLLISALVLFVLLFIAPKTLQKTSEEVLTTSGKAENNGNLSMYLNMALKVMDLGQKQKAEKFLESKNYDSLSTLWSKLKRPDLAAYYTEEKARSKKDLASWQDAGNRYYYSVQFTQDKTEIPVLYQCAMRCFKECLSLDPKNVDAKIMLASCYVEGGENPMEGISQLREVEKTDSNNVKLQLTFAFFSVKSRQFDKAIQRFKKVLAVDSTYIEAYLHLADAYEQQGKTPETIQMLETYASKTSDVTARLEIEKYIQQLQQK